MAAKYFEQTTFAYEPGTSFLYINAPATLLAKILAEQFVDFTTSPQVDSSNIFGYAKLDRFSDNVFGYSGMMWISHGDLGYRAEGAFGQFGIVVPKLDLIIAITQSLTESPVSQTTLDQVWEFVETI